jgi:hypothetical protein
MPALSFALKSYFELAKQNGDGNEWPCLIDPVREMLIKLEIPYIADRRSVGSRHGFDVSWSRRGATEKASQKGCE